jgi:NADH:ubiquinone oxidoreductase subunit 3 (subunit A)
MIASDILSAAYIPVLFYAFLVLLFPVIAFLAFKRNGTEQQPDTPASDDGGNTYPVRFFVIAALFTIFATATIFLFPWAILFRGWIEAHFGFFALVSVFAFLGILFVGYIWVYKNGALHWD